MIASPTNRWPSCECQRHSRDLAWFQHDYFFAFHRLLRGSAQCTFHGNLRVPWRQREGFLGAAHGLRDASIQGNAPRRVDFVKVRDNHFQATLFDLPHSGLGVVFDLLKSIPKFSFPSFRFRPDDFIHTSDKPLEERYGCLV